MGRITTLPAKFNTNGCNTQLSGEEIVAGWGIKILGPSERPGCNKTELPEGWTLDGSHGNCADILDEHGRIRIISYPSADPPSATIKARFTLERDRLAEKNGKSSVDIRDAGKIIKTFSFPSDEVSACDDCYQQAAAAARAWLAAQSPKWEDPICTWDITIDPDF